MLHTRLGDGLKLGISVIEIPSRNLWPVTETDKDGKFQLDVRGSLKVSCPAYPGIPGRVSEPSLPGSEGSGPGKIKDEGLGISQRGWIPPRSQRTGRNSRKEIRGEWCP